MKPATIVIVTCNRIKKTAQCLESVIHHTEYPYKLIVVDNGSKDETPDYLVSHRKWIDRLILLDENLGTAKAQNIGWMLSDKEYYIKLDDDVVILRDEWLEVLVGMSNMLPEYAAFGHIWFKGHTRRFTRGFYLADTNDNIDFYSPTVLIPKRTFEKLGYWTTAFGIYGFEDFDYRFRMQLAALRYCYAGDINYVKHLGPNMDPEDGKELFEAKLKSRKEGEGIRMQLAQQYKDGIESIYIHNPI